MPTYDFEHRKTGEHVEIEMKMSEYDQFVIDHPELQRVHITPATIGDAVVLGVQKPPADFQKFLGRMRDRIPGAKKESFGRKFNIPKEI